MNIIVYLTCILLAVYCINKAICMSFSVTSRVIIYSYIVLFGGIAGIALWTYFYGANFVIAILMTGLTMVFVFDKRQASRKRYAK